MWATNMTGKKYFPNKWQLYKDAPEEMFEPHTFEELMVWKIHQWQFAPGVKGVLRVRDMQTNKVKEYTYKQELSLMKKFVKLLESEKELEITVGNDQEISIHYNKDHEFNY